MIFTTKQNHIGCTSPGKTVVRSLLKEAGTEIHYKEARPGAFQHRRNGFIQAGALSRYVNIRVRGNEVSFHYFETNLPSDQAAYVVQCSTEHQFHITVVCSRPRTQPLTRSPFDLPICFLGRGGRHTRDGVISCQLFLSSSHFCGTTPTFVQTVHRIGQ